MHRTLRRLQEQGEIEIEMGVGMHGLVAFARLLGGHRDAFCHRDSVTPNVEAETVDRPTASAENPGSQAASRLVIGRADAHRHAPRGTTAHTKSTTSTATRH